MRNSSRYTAGSRPSFRHSRDRDNGSLGRHGSSHPGCAGNAYRRDDVSTREIHKIWTEQCEATHDIRLHYGPQAAFDYGVAEKLLSFAEAAAGLSSRESCPGLSPV